MTDRERFYQITDDLINETRQLDKTNDIVITLTSNETRITFFADVMDKDGHSMISVSAALVLSCWDGLLFRTSYIDNEYIPCDEQETSEDEWKKLIQDCIQHIKDKTADKEPEEETDESEE